MSIAAPIMIDYEIIGYTRRAKPVWDEHDYYRLGRMGVAPTVTGSAVVTHRHTDVVGLIDYADIRALYPNPKHPDLLCIYPEGMTSISIEDLCIVDPVLARSFA